MRFLIGLALGIGGLLIFVSGWLLSEASPNDPVTQVLGMALGCIGAYLIMSGSDEVGRED